MPASSRWIAFPTSVEPVKAILSTFGCLTRLGARAAVAGDVDDAGRQLGLAQRRRTTAPSRSSAGLRTTVFPAASAGAIFHASMSSGKFHGMIWPATPPNAGSGAGTHARACRPSRRSRRSVRPPAEGRRRRDSLIGFPPFSDSSTANSRERSCRMRAIRKRYFARSAGEIVDQPLSYASRAACTARSTSSGPTWPTSASTSSDAGLMVGKYSPRLQLDKLHHRRCREPCCCSWSVTMSRASGAGA